MPDLYLYGAAVHLYKPIIKRAVVDFAVGADWTPAAGDVKISKDGGAAANVTNLPTAIAMGNTAMWDYSLTATEMQAAKIRITVSDSATKAVEDTMFEIDTYGNASAQHAVNLNDSVRAGLTALPNAAAEAAGGLYTRGSGAGQINQTTNGTVDVAVTRWGGNAVAATSVNGVPIVDVKYFLGTAITEGGAGRIAARFTGVYDAASNGYTAATAMSAYAGGAVASVTAGVTVTTNNDKTGYALTAAYDAAKTASQAGDAMTLTAAGYNAAADALLARNISGGSSAGRTVKQAFHILRNKTDIAANTLTVYDTDDASASWTATITTTAGNPISQIDPA